jgi:hypothetical protein
MHAVFPKAWSSQNPPHTGPVRHDKRDASPVCGRPAGVGCSVRRTHIAFALASLSIGLGAVVADQGPGVGLRQQVRLSAASEPLLSWTISPPTKERGSKTAPQPAPAVFEELPRFTLRRRGGFHHVYPLSPSRETWVSRHVSTSQNENHRERSIRGGRYCNSAPADFMSCL